MTLESVALMLARIALAVAGVGVLLALAGAVLLYGLDRFANALGLWWAFVRFYPHRAYWKRMPVKPTPRGKAPTVADPVLHAEDE